MLLDFVESLVVSLCKVVLTCFSVYAVLELILFEVS